VTVLRALVDLFDEPSFREAQTRGRDLAAHRVTALFR
jgi:hypothetical protein